MTELANQAASADAFDADIAAIARIGAVPQLLRVLCQSTGMGFAAVARVTAGHWVACAVEDSIGFGLKPGGQLDIDSTLCKEVRESRTPIVIDRASTDAAYSNHHTPRIYAIESYISVPITLEDGSYFGNLCAIDRQPAKITAPHIVAMFDLFAQLVALELDSQNKRDAVQRALLAERSAGELREQFIGVLGHDLRNPLSAIAACGQLARLKAGDADAVRSLSFKIDTNVKRMARMIDDITDFARGRLDGGNNLGAEAVDDLDESLMQVVTELRDAHPDRSIAATIDIGAVVRCDRGRLQQLLSNLLANALTHGGSGGRVSVSATIDDDLVIEVWNDGEPIPESMLGKIFGPYWRGHSSPRGGLGLGLHICNQIAMAHGGRIDVRSSAAAGTTFTARLPIVVRD